jgi:hypothetical protein
MGLWRGLGSAAFVVVATAVGILVIIWFAST